MGQFAIVGVRIMLVALFAVGVIAQVFWIPDIVENTIRTFPEVAGLRLPGVAVGIVLVACLQVAIFCMWRLLTLVDRLAIFERGALGPVNVIICAFGGVALTAVVGFAFVTGAGFGPPGIILLLAGITVVSIGLALLMLVMRELLIRAMQMDADLAEVI